MNAIREIGHDGSGNPVRLGDIDGWGYKVGYIDEEGLAWESADERDLSLGVGQFEDDYRQWFFWNPDDSAQPNRYEYMLLCDPHNRKEFLKRIEFFMTVMHPLTLDWQTRRAAENGLTWAQLMERLHRKTPVGRPFPPCRS